jgi:hypothetical protein
VSNYARSNTPNGSWGIIQVLPTTNVAACGIPPTEVGGLFRSNLSAIHTCSTYSENLPLTVIRLDLEPPPTAVGGIQESLLLCLVGWT